MTNVMTTAWEIAYEGVEKFGGQVKEYFAEALRIAWDLFKNTNSKEMEEMELVKEVQFGKAAARVTVKGAFANKTFSQFIEGGEVIITQKIEIVHNGQVVDEGDYAYSLEYDVIDDRTYEKNNLDTNKTYTQIKGKKNVMFCEGKEVAEEINTLIKEMKKEVALTLKGEVKKVEEFDVVANAKNIVEEAKKQGVKNLKTEQEIKEWKKNYNNVVNEGGEGYVPQLISKERYENALKVIANA